MKKTFLNIISYCFVVLTFSVSSFGLDNEVATESVTQSSFDSLFIEKMTRHHQDSVDMGKFAIDKGESSEIKSISQKIIDDQTKEIAQMREWKMKWYKDDVTKADMPKMDMSHLQTLKGKEFDKMFLTMMTEHHQGAITISKDMMPKLKHKQIKDFAKNIIKKQKSEIAQLEKLESKIE